MAKKKKVRRKPSKADSQERGTKSRAIRDYVVANKTAKPKDIVAGLKEQGIEVSPNMASMVKARMKVGRAKRRAKQAIASHDVTAGAKSKNSAALDAALLLYKAARGQEVQPAKVRQSFLLLVDSFG